MMTILLNAKRKYVLVLILYLIMTWSNALVLILKCDKIKTKTICD